MPFFSLRSASRRSARARVCAFTRLVWCSHPYVVVCKPCVRCAHAGCLIRMRFSFLNDSTTNATLPVVGTEEKARRPESWPRSRPCAQPSLAAAAATAAPTAARPEPLVGDTNLAKASGPNLGLRKFCCACCGCVSTAAAARRRATAAAGCCGGCGGCGCCGCRRLRLLRLL